MRLSAIFVAAVTLAAAGCDCRARLSSQAPKLVIVQPTAKVGSEWVLDFGTVQAAGTYTQTIVIENQGRMAGNVSSVQLRAGSDPTLSLSGSAPAQVLPGLSDTITVTYAPSQP